MWRYTDYYEIEKKFRYLETWWQTEDEIVVIRIEQLVTAFHEKAC